MVSPAPSPPFSTAFPHGNRRTKKKQMALQRQNTKTTQDEDLRKGAAQGK